MAIKYNYTVFYEEIDGEDIFFALESTLWESEELKKVTKINLINCLGSEELSAYTSNFIPYLPVFCEISIGNGRDNIVNCDTMFSART